jgi:hypothetical protein
MSILRLNPDRIKVYEGQVIHPITWHIFVIVFNSLHETKLRTGDLQALPNPQVQDKKIEFKVGDVINALLEQFQYLSTKKITNILRTDKVNSPKEHDRNNGQRLDDLRYIEKFLQAGHRHLTNASEKDSHPLGVIPVLNFRNIFNLLIKLGASEKESFKLTLFLFQLNHILICKMKNRLEIFYEVKQLNDKVILILKETIGVPQNDETKEALALSNNIYNLIIKYEKYNSQTQTRLVENNYNDFVLRNQMFTFRNLWYIPIMIGFLYFIIPQINTYFRDMIAVSQITLNEEDEFKIENKVFSRKKIIASLANKKIIKKPYILNIKPNIQSKSNVEFYYNSTKIFSTVEVILTPQQDYVTTLEELCNVFKVSNKYVDSSNFRKGKPSRFIIIINNN